jgi:hypothetical protein
MLKYLTAAASLDLFDREHGVDAPVDEFVVNGGVDREDAPLPARVRLRASRRRSSSRDRRHEHRRVVRLTVL